MRASIAMGVVFFAAQGALGSSWAGLVVAEARQHAGLADAAAAEHRLVGHQALWLTSTRVRAGPLAAADLPPAAPVPVVGPGEASRAARLLEPREVADPDRSDMVMMVLVGLAMLLTVVVKGNRA